MDTFKFDYRDVLRAPRLAFSLQRMWTQLTGLFVGYLGYLILTYVSFIAAGFQLGETWDKYGLLPCLFVSGESFPWYSWLIYAAGSMILFIAFLITNTAVARATYMIAKGNNFYTWREAFAFAFRKAGSVVLTPVSLAVLIGFIIVGALIIGLLGKIPYVGELGISLFTILWFFAALLIFFFIIVAVVSIFLVPSIIATTDEDAFEAVFQTFSIVWNKPWKFLFYEFLTVLMSVLALGIFAAVAKESIMIMNSLLAAFMGSDFINLANNGQGLLQSWLFLAQSLIEGIYRNYSQYVFFSHEFILIPASDLPATVVIAAYLYALSLLFIAGWVVSYAISTFTVGNMLSYLALRKQKDNENLLERKDKEEEEEEEKKEEEKEQEMEATGQEKEEDKDSGAAADDTTGVEEPKN